MQQTRQVILEVLHERGQLTVDELVKALAVRFNYEITAVTVRHHLEILRGEGLVTPPSVRHRSSPGRPQHVFSLTEKALEQFPNNYQHLANNLLTHMKDVLPRAQTNQIIEKMADQMIAEAGELDLPIEERIVKAVAFLKTQGYDAEWLVHEDGIIVRSHNCPYRKLTSDHEELCAMDTRLIAGLTGVTPRCLSHIANQQPSCDYLIPLEPASK
jgi:predicted ArsR family transcriptional regulator